MTISLTVLFAVLMAAAPVGAGEKATEQRLDEVAQRGAHVMPFELEQTTHIFSKTATGGVQQVIVKNKTDTQQIALIRKHLSKISQEFAHGDFSDPEKIQGKNMPGLAELSKAKLGQITVEYREIAGGAEIVYETEAPNLIDTLHQWFDAQLSDHARHAMPGHSQHRMHGQ